MSSVNFPSGETQEKEHLSSKISQLFSSSLARPATLTGIRASAQRHRVPDPAASPPNGPGSLRDASPLAGALTGAEGKVGLEGRVQPHGSRPGPIRNAAPRGNGNVRCQAPKMLPCDATTIDQNHSTEFQKENHSTATIWSIARQPLNGRPIIQPTRCTPATIRLKCFSLSLSPTLAQFHIQDMLSLSILLWVSKQTVLKG
jgi:hypothetical protein